MIRFSWDTTSMRTYDYGGEDADEGEDNHTYWRSSAPAPSFARPRLIPAHCPPDLRLVVARKGEGEGFGSAERRESFHGDHVPYAPHCRRALARGLAGQSGKENDGFLRCACSTSTSLVCARMCNTTSAGRFIRSAHPHIHVRLHDLIGRERENWDNANPGGGVCPVDFDMRLTDENAVRVVHPNPKLNPNFSEPDYGPSSQWSVSHLFQPAPGPVSFYLAMTMYQTQTQTNAAAAAVRSWQPTAYLASSPSPAPYDYSRRSSMCHAA